jgi:hypothetical protein
MGRGRYTGIMGDVLEEAGMRALVADTYRRPA